MELNLEPGNRSSYNTQASNNIGQMGLYFQLGPALNKTHRHKHPLI